MRESHTVSKQSNSIYHTVVVSPPFGSFGSYGTVRNADAAVWYSTVCGMVWYGAGESMQVYYSSFGVLIIVLAHMIRLV
jgi:hypothetical protein